MTKKYFETLQPGDDLSAAVTAFLTAHGRADTLAHIRAVVAAAKRLAAYCGVDIEAAAAAAWCHDIAAVVPGSEILAVAEAWDVPLTDDERAIPAVVHGPLAAAVAERQLGITDADLLHAIRFHSTLRAGASALEKVVFVADKLALDPTAPRRDFLPALKAAQVHGLDAMALVYLDWVIANAPDMGWTVHPNLRAAHAELSAAQTDNEG